MAKKPNKGRGGPQPPRQDARAAPPRNEPRPAPLPTRPAVSSPAAAISGSTDAGRARLRDALAAAANLRGSKAEIAALPASLRTLGVGQVLSVYALDGVDRPGARQEVARSVGRQLAAYLARLDPAMAGEGVAPVLHAWTQLGDRARVQVLEQELIAWSVDLKLMLCLVEAARVDALNAVPWDEAPRQASAVRAVVALREVASDRQELTTRLQSLPWELRHHGLARALAILHREAGERFDDKVQGKIARSLYARLLGHPARPFGTPLAPSALVGVLLDDSDGGARAATLEHEALAWAVELKRCASTFHADDGGYRR
jgi:hypothetical protein